MNINYDKIISDIEYLLKWYSHEFRATVQPFREDIFSYKYPDNKFDVENKLIRESLLEHVGTLPILATYLHWCIEQNINLWRVLSMLAIHDIWEIVVWDEICFLKNDWNKKFLEQEEALKLLSPKHHNLYKEFKESITKEAKFAKSIDKISPDFIDLFMDVDKTVIRFKYFLGIDKDEIIPMIEAHKAPFMSWSPFFEWLHKEIMKKMREKFLSK